MVYILPFNSTEATLSAVGGKGANLVELTRAGFAVPPGFLVTTEAYCTFVTANNINARLLELARSAARDDPIALDHVSAEMRALFAQAEMPDDVAHVIDEAYASLADVPVSAVYLPVAVRSSATAEDLPGLSFAGQQETYLNIVGVDAVRAAVKKCWASLWTARALSYRARNGIAPDDVRLAVVVQQMIASDVSGVLFTANPLTGRRDEVVIDASFGLGEAIVSGQVEPDHYAVAQDPDGQSHITTRKLGAKALTIVPRADGGTDTLTQTDAYARQALTDEQILALAAIGRRIAAHYGAPQDVEWAWANQQFYILQARPITSLYPLPDLPYAPDDVRIYFSFNAGQGVPDPFTPMGLAVFHLIARGLPFKRSPREFIPEAGKRLFLDLTDPTRDPRLRKLVLAGLARGDPAARQTLMRLLEAGRVPTRHILTPLYAIKLLVGARRVLARLAHNMRDPEGAPARALTQADRYLSQVQSHVHDAPNLAALLDAMEKDVPAMFSHMLAYMLPVIFPALAGMSVVDNWLNKWLGLPHGSALALMRSLPGNVTAEMNLKLWAAAQTIRADHVARECLLNTSVEQLVTAYHQRTLPPTAQNAIEKFLDEYGMRAVAEIDIGRERWREDPAAILQTLHGYLQLDDPNLAPDVSYRRGAVEAERLGQAYVERVRRTRSGAIRAKLLGGMIRRIRTMGGARETPKFYAIKMIDLYRSALLTHGRALVAQGKLAQPDDIFFVPLDDLKNLARGQAVDLQAIVAVQRADYARERTRKQLPHLLLSTGEVFYGGMSETGGSDLVGDGVSPGVVEGVVRVVLDPRGVRLEPGEILVCPATDPGWTPLFLTAGGLIMEIGGMVTHGSVVAREYGLPAVVGVHEATTRLKTGQRVRVDGSTGRVTVVSEK